MWYNTDRQQRSPRVEPIVLSIGTQSEKVDWFAASKRSGRVEIDPNFQQSLLADLVKKQ